jgi:hypothetical protein
VFASVGQRAVRRVARDTFAHILDLDLRFHLTRQTGGLTRAIDRGTKSVLCAETRAVLTPGAGASRSSCRRSCSASSRRRSRSRSCAASWSACLLSVVGPCSCDDRRTTLGGTLPRSRSRRWAHTPGSPCARRLGGSFLQLPCQADADGSTAPGSGARRTRRTTARRRSPSTAC